MLHQLMVITAVHLSALGQIESGGNDHAIGARGEVSRYQVLPAVWREHEQEVRLKLDPANETTAREVVYSEWAQRLDRFQKERKRGATPAELYLLWNCPAAVLHPSKTESGRAERFANLVEKLSDADRH